MNAIVIGGSGNLGQALITTMVRAGANVLCPSHQEMDLTNEIAVRKFITSANPTYVINAAAMTDVDRCEREPDLAKLINGRAVGFAASAARKVKAKFIQISTDYVFDGRSLDPYSEYSVPHPLQEYGASKLLGEQYALEKGGSVFRVQWLFGQIKGNFIDWVAQSLMEGKKIPIFDQVGCPHSAFFVANLLVLSLQACRSGVYHIAHDQATSRQQVAKYILGYFRKDPKEWLVEPIPQASWVAERPRSVALGTQELKSLLGVKTFGTWEADVLAYLSSRYNRWNR